MKKTEGHGPPESSLNQPSLGELQKKTPSQAAWIPEPGRLCWRVPTGKPGRLGTPLPAPAPPGVSAGFPGHTVLGSQSKESPGRRERRAQPVIHNHDFLLLHVTVRFRN